MREGECDWLALPVRSRITHTSASSQSRDSPGVQPDVQVSLDAADLDRGHDAQVAVQRLRAAMAATAR